MYLFLTGGRLLYSAVLVSAAQRHELATGMRACPPSRLLHPTPPGRPRAPGVSPCVTQRMPAACLTRGGVHVSRLLRPCVPPSRRPLGPRVCPLRLHLRCCPEKGFTSTIFLDSTYTRRYTIVVFLLLAYFTLYNRLSVHPPH